MKSSDCDCAFCLWCAARRRQQLQNIAMFVLAIAVTSVGFYFLRFWE